MMKTVKQDVRFQAESFEKIRQIAKEDNATIQDTIRKLCDMGIAQQLTKNSDQSVMLTPVEEEILLSLKSIAAMTNVITTTTLDIKKTPYGSFDELGKHIKKTARESLQKFKDKIRISD